MLFGLAPVGGHVGFDVAAAAPSPAQTRSASAGMTNLERKLRQAITRRVVRGFMGLLEEQGTSKSMVSEVLPVC
jgi:hypothetical protein